MDIDRDFLLLGLACVIATGVLMLIPTVIVSSRLWRAVAGRHPEVWKDLGEPRLQSMGILKSRSLRDYLRYKKYQELSDPQIDRYASRLRLLNRLVALLFWIGVVLLLLSAASAGTASAGT